MVFVGEYIVFNYLECVIFFEKKLCVIYNFVKVLREYDLYCNL